MPHTLKVAAVALDIVHADRQKNLHTAVAMSGHLIGRPDVIVFPELFSTGLVKDPQQLRALADNVDEHPSLDTLRSIAAARNAAVCASVLWHDKSADTVSNRCMFVEPDGEMMTYDKRHLFCLSPESTLLVAGTTRTPVIRFRACNFAMAVCYDLRFPGVLRNNGHRRYDVLLMPSNWPQSRQFAWQTLLMARAIENQAYVVGANRSGSDDFGSYDAMSMICAPSGHSIGNYHPDTEAVYAEIDMTHLEETRLKFPFLDEADFR